MASPLHHETSDRPDAGATALLESRGYTLLDKLGEGATRETWRAAFRSGSLNQLRVVQIPKAITAASSVTTRHNFANGRNMDEREVLLTNEMEHPNIISILEAIDYNGRTITAQPYFDAVSLTDYVNKHGTLTDPKAFVAVFNPTIRGLAFAANKGRVHRDVKPENILVSTKTDAVKVGDWQNVGDLRGDARALPTRGGAATLEPSTLQAIIEGTPVTPSIKQDIFALGASMYFALTGKPLFDQKIVEYEHDGVSRLAVKTASGTSIGFDGVQYTKRIAEAIAEVPKRFRPLLRTALKADTFHGYEVVQDQLQQLQKPYLTQQLKTLIRYAKPFLIATGVATGIVAGGALVYRSDSRVGNESIDGFAQQINQSAFSNGTPKGILYNADTSLLAMIVKTTETASRDSAKADSLMREYNARPMEMNGVNMRFAYAVARALTNSNRYTPSGRLSNLWGGYDDYERRMRSSGYVNEQDLNWGNMSEDERKRREIVAMQETLRRCQALSEVDDALACYLLDDESRTSAFNASGRTHYLSRAKSTVQGTFAIPGYREKLSPQDRALVDRGIAHYLMADKEGGMTRQNLEPITRALISARHSK